MLEVELYGALPVPGYKVPIPEILEFRSHRRDELQRFRRAMDGLYLEITKSRDVPRATDAAIMELHESILAANQTMAEAPFRRVLTSLKVEFSLSDALITGLVAAKAAAILTLPPALLAIIGFAGAAIKVDTPVVPRIKNLPREVQDYAYVGQVMKEFSTAPRRIQK